MKRIQRPWPALSGALLALALLALSVAPVVGRDRGGDPHTAPATGPCQLGPARGTTQHMIYLQFDNLHFTRDIPTVPSDLEQMPHLLNFLTSNGVLLANHHTPLISHTATDILTSLTGVYPDHHGVAVSNSYRYFNADGSSSSTGAFSYWTAPIGNGTYNMLSAPNTNAPAPWVPFTRAGCNVGVVAAGNIALENTGHDVDTVFGATSPQHQEAASQADQAYADFVGIAVHCAQGDAHCSAANGGVPDVLPSEPGGYPGYGALFGHRYVAPVISPKGPLTDLNGMAIPGFPGFDGMTPAVSLAYVAAMQEQGVPVTYGYLADAHDDHGHGRAFGPGEAGYVAALQSYDAAFATFLARLAADGLNSSNTLFVVTADEGDHFIGGPPSPEGCDGVITPCTYSQIGEINANLTGLLATTQGITTTQGVNTTFAVHADSAPVIYVNGHPDRAAAGTRQLERALGRLTAPNPLTHVTEAVTQYLADPVEMGLLHMVTADPARTATLTMFARPDYFLFAGPPSCAAPCVTENPAFAWNHGDVQADITTTWLGLVGPGVRAQGEDTTTWSDHTDIRPTMLLLLGLHDDYASDGRALLEPLDTGALPAAWGTQRDLVQQLARVYKQINAPLGPLGRDSLRLSTQALESGAADNDSTYTALENQLLSVTAQRNSLAAQMAALLQAATVDRQLIDAAQARNLIAQAQALLQAVHAAAGS